MLAQVAIEACRRRVGVVYSVYDYIASAETSSASHLSALTKALYVDIRLWKIPLLIAIKLIKIVNKAQNNTLICNKR